MVRAWAKQRTSQIEEIGMSVEMEVLVCDLLEELREEPGALDLTESAAAQAALLQRARIELRFIERHAQQAVAIVLGRSSVNAPNVLAECLDWLCVHVPVDELPLQFRPNRRPRPARPKPVAGAGGGAAARCGVVGSEANSAASLGAPLDDDDDWDDGSTKPWNCERCTLENAADATRCEACEADRPPPPPPPPRRRAREAAAQARAVSAFRAQQELAAARARLPRLARWQGAGADGRQRGGGAGHLAARAPAQIGTRGRRCRSAAPPADAAEAEALAAARDEEVLAMESILGPERAAGRGLPADHAALGPAHGRGAVGLLAGGGRRRRRRRRGARREAALRPLRAARLPAADVAPRRLGLLLQDARRSRRRRIDRRRRRL